MIEAFADHLMYSASAHTILWVEGMCNQFPRQRPQPTDLGKTSDVIIYRT
jgi:hypothetical protein